MLRKTNITSAYQSHWLDYEVSYPCKIMTQTGLIISIMINYLLCVVFFFFFLFFLFLYILQNSDSLQYMLHRFSIFKTVYVYYIIYTCMA